MLKKSFTRLFSTINKKCVFLLGPPGVGKTFFGAKMAADHNYELIVLGDELRNLSTDSTSETYKDFNTGKLIDDDVVFDTLSGKIRGDTEKIGYIIEGYPRTARQLELYVEKDLPINLVLNFTLPREVLEKRVLGRISCTCCKSTYNYFSFKSNGLDIDINLPKEEGVCDECGGEVKRRPDDTKEVAEQKMSEYYNASEGVIKDLILNSMKGDTKKYNVIEYSPVHGFKNYKDFASKIKLVFESL